MSRWLALVLIAAGAATAHAVSSARTPPGRTASAGTPSFRTPPPAARFSYQIGGAFRPAAGVKIVDRDWHDQPVAGTYNVCYVNAFQAQPEEIGWWRAHHPNLLLYKRGRPVVDETWSEQLFDVSSAGKRRALAQIEAAWMTTCARKGFDAVEPDNLDSYSRSRGRLTLADDLAFARLLIGTAHAAHLAIAQKNTSELGNRGRRAGFDFAIAEECQAYSECGSYTRPYGHHVIEVEYPDNGGVANFLAACRARGTRISIEYRDRDVLPRGRHGYLERWCSVSG